MAIVKQWPQAPVSVDRSSLYLSCPLQAPLRLRFPSRVAASAGDVIVPMRSCPARPDTDVSPNMTSIRQTVGQ